MKMSRKVDEKLGIKNSHSEKFDISKEKQLKQTLEQEGFNFKAIDHALWSAQNKAVNVTLYKSGKILVQGNGTEDFVLKYLNNSAQLSLIAKTAVQNSPEDHSFTSWIGSDESGKGDYFGPLVIASVLVDETNKNKLTEIGVKDSKTLNDKQIGVMSAKIKNCSIFSTVVINPQKYNELYDKFKNLNKMLAWGHARAIENILEKKPCENAISDKFGDESLIKNALLKHGRSINLIQKTKAESDIAVAAASILARDEFVKRLAQFSKIYNIDLPKGASEKTIKQANLFAEKYGIAMLGSIAKLHFKTTRLIKSV
jgi:ribonuclease HIII